MESRHTPIERPPMLGFKQSKKEMDIEMDGWMKELINVWMDEYLIIDA